MPLVSRTLRRALLPFSWLYARGAAWNRARGAANHYSSLLPVISVGNLSVGGAGKTPLVIHLVELLQAQWPVVVLSRGYRRKEQAPVVWRSGEAPPDPDLVGDEPALIARAINHGALGIAADRAGLLRSIEAGMPDAVVLLDDGFQHHRLARDLDIVIVDERTAWFGDPLPAGDLREHPSALRHADVVVVTSPVASEFARRWKRADAPILDIRFIADKIILWKSGAAAELRNPFILVTGIARPERVVDAVGLLGLTSAVHIELADHHDYSSRDVDRIVATMKKHGATAVLTTAKDAVKLERFPELMDFLYVIQVRIEMPGEEELRRLLYAAIERIKETRATRVSA